MKENRKWKMKRKGGEEQTKRKGSSVDKKGGRRKEEKKLEKEKKIEGERKKGGEKKREIFPAFQQSNLNGLRIKVDPRNEGYAWVPKSGSFVKLQEVGNFPTWILSSLKVI